MKDAAKEPAKQPVPTSKTDAAKEPAKQPAEKGGKDGKRVAGAGGAGPVSPVPAAPGKSATGTPGKTAPPTPPASKPPAPKPLSEQLKNYIRSEVAIAKIDKLFEPIRTDVVEYSDTRGAYEADKVKGGRETSPPPEPDFAKLAEQLGLSFHRTGMMSQWDIRDTDIGQSNIGEAAAAFGGSLVARYAFDLGKFSPRKSGTRPDQLSQIWKYRYLFWKTADEREEVPKFEAVRQEVLKAWQLVQARPLALKKARSLADEARDAHKSFHALLANQPNAHVLTPPKFSWLPSGRDVSETGVSEVKGLNLPGSDFMRAVFALEPGATTAVFNAPHTIAYAIYLDDLSPSYNVRWDEFEIEPYSNYATVARDDLLAMRRAWVDEIKHSVDFKEVSVRRLSGAPSSDSDEPIDFGGF